ncbi:MAG TPA: protein-disulfide reductase DsbD domain-containing protein [Casimicrobiaceae bacterium]|nr:protein-disulfide reductase DsbD domain-containing protein [Casimicrobiaceae bacterium]
MSSVARGAGAALLALATAGLGEPPDLLENERAFAFAARGVDAQTVEARFVVAPGYYLYRDKLHFRIEGAPAGDAPKLPRGEMKHDDFFGDSETLRGTVSVRLPLARPAAARAVSVIAQSQGCADIGVCYPPQEQKVTLTMPAGAARPTAFVEAAPERKRWFR